MTAPIRSFRGLYCFLSNFFPSNIAYNGRLYPTAEHAYQAQKTLDKETRDIISKLKSPHAAKAYGNKIELRKDWEKIKVRKMEEIVRTKFCQNKGLRMLLKETGNRKIIEGNTWGDTFWGTCNGVGENHLGKILMKIREELR